MKVIDVVHIVAGTLITLSVVLSILHSQWWLLVTAFVGVNLLQFGFTKWCLLESLLKQYTKLQS